MTPAVVVTVAGTDSGGAAGIAADLTTFAALGVHGACVVTAVTAQDTVGVHDVHPIPLRTIETQLDAVLGDLPVAAVKTGMLGTAGAVACLRARFEAFGATRPALVVDPVLVATSGAVLGDASVRDAYVEHLLPLATVVTPNLAEARALARAAGLDDAGPAAELAAALAGLGPAVVVTGGGEPEGGACVDWIAAPGEQPVPLRHPALATANDHGTGCTFSAAVAALVARGETDLSQVAARAAAFTGSRLQAGRTWSLGRGRGPVAHIFPLHPTTEGDRR